MATAVEPADAGALQEALKSVRERIKTASAERSGGPDLPEVRLVAVSKTKPLEDLKAAYDLGQRVFGENYVRSTRSAALGLQGRQCSRACSRCDPRLAIS